MVKAVTSLVRSTHLLHVTDASAREASPMLNPGVRIRSNGSSLPPHRSRAAGKRVPRVRPSSCRARPAGEARRQSHGRAYNAAWLHSLRRTEEGGRWRGEDAGNRLRDVSGAWCWKGRT